MIFSPEKDRDKRDRDGVIPQFVADRATLWAAFAYIHRTAALWRLSPRLS